MQVRPSARAWILAALVGCVLLPLLAPVAQAAPTAEQIVARARKAIDTYSYTGIRRIETYTGDQTFIERQRVYRAPKGRERFEVISPASTAGNLAILDGRTHWRYYPSRRLASKSPATTYGSDPLVGDLFNSGAKNHLILSTTATVAGRKSYVVKVFDAKGRLRLTAYIDADKYVLLGMDRRQPNGSLVDSWRFEKLTFVRALARSLFEFHPPAGTRIVSEPTHTTRLRLKEAARRLGMRPMLPAKLPDGYHFVPSMVSVVRSGRHEALHMVFSNGVERFSIFQSRQLRPSAHRRANVVRWDLDGYTLLVVGHLDKADLRVIKSSLPHISPGS